MRSLKAFATRELRISPEQVQVFTPTPSTLASVMYYTETDPTTGEPLFVEKDRRKKEQQKKILVEKNHKTGKRAIRENVPCSHRVPGNRNSRTGQQSGNRRKR